MISYYISGCSPDNVTYSIDKLILDFKLRMRSGEEFASGFLLFLSMDLDLVFESWEVRKIGTFRQQFRFQCPDGSSFWVGVGLNTAGRVGNRVRLEFNPNKVGRDLSFIRVFNRLQSLAVGPPRFVRLDLAVDVPVLRENIFLLKDRRLYEEYWLSNSNRTQYLGARNKPGRCKLYNKQLESGLSFPLSRFEITLDGERLSPLEVLAIWPKVIILDDLQMVFDFTTLPDDDRVIVWALLDDPGRLCDLGKRNKKKFGRILDQYTRTLALDIPLYEKIIQGLGVFRQTLPVF